MSEEEKALIPVEQREIEFYEDEVVAVIVTVDDKREVFVPVRPITERLGLNWAGQQQRINRDPVLSVEIKPCVVVTHTQGQPDQRRQMLCLPLDYVNGFLFGINANRVREEVRDRLIRYQRECYKVLADAFVDRPAAAEVSSSTATLLQVRELGRAIMQMAEEQIEFERRLTTTEDQLSQTTIVVGDIDKRVASLEKKLSPGQTVTEEQASQISQAVKAVAMKLSEQSGRNEYGGVYGELYRRFSITSYKLLPVTKFEPAMRWLTEWYQTIADDKVPF